MNGASVETTQRVTADNGVEYAYRDQGEGDVPLVLLQHFRGNLDNWDPALIDELAAERRVVTFDNVGVGATTGTTPNTVEAMAHDAIAFLEAMDLQRVDLLGFSLGSFVAQEIALDPPRPACGASCSRPRHRRARRGCTAGRRRSSARSASRRRPRRNTSASSSPPRARVFRRARRPPGASSGRTTDRDEPTTWQTRQAQYDAVCAWGIPNHSLLQRVAAIDMPVFVANGDSDPMILPRYSHLLAGLLPNARVTIYPDSAHGFLFQHHSQFAADVHAFLSD